ncbi:transcriptional regulator, partial [Escherichia coli]|nr:transcriptional regulator [Escherichia coli]
NRSLWLVIGLITLAVMVFAGGHFYTFFKDYKTVAEINGCHFNVTEDTIDGLKEFDKYKTRILDSGINCKKHPWLYFPLAKSSPGMIVMACNKNYNQHEVADCLTLSYREVNRD